MRRGRAGRQHRREPRPIGLRPAEGDRPGPDRGAQPLDAAVFSLRYRCFQGEDPGERALPGRGGGGGSVRSGVDGGKRREAARRQRASRGCVRQQRRAAGGERHLRGCGAPVSARRPRRRLRRGDLERPVPRSFASA